MEIDRQNAAAKTTHQDETRIKQNMHINDGCINYYFA